MNKLSAFAVFAVLVCAVGCGFNEKSLVGSWTGTVNLSAEDQKNEQAAAAAGAMKATLEFKEDKTYTLSMGLPLEGTWAYADNNVTMTTTKVMGMDISSIPGAEKDNKPQVLKVEDGGKKLTMSIPESQGSTITFTKNESK
jgi:hypothetical protein